MELWLDTVDVKSVRSIADLGILQGVTTTPRLLQEAKKPEEKLLTELLDAQEGVVAVQVEGDTLEKRVSEVKRLQAFSPRIMIKVPNDLVGLKMIHHLREEEISILSIANQSVIDAFLSYKVGADYAVFYIGSMEEGSLSPKDEIIKAMDLKNSLSYPTKVMVGGIRSKNHLGIALAAKVSAITIPPNLFFEL